MATTQTLPPPPPAPAHPHDAAELAAEKALVHTLQAPVEGAAMVLSAAIAQLPVELDVSVPVRNFRVRNLLTIEPGVLIETQWAHGEDMPLAAGNVQLAWSEFEVVDTSLAVRVTRLV